MTGQPSVLSRTLAEPLSEVEGRVRAALKDEGFGVLTEIDVQATLAEKLGHEMEPYLILGACNPALAKRAIEVAPDIGAFLPCNVMLRANATGGTDVVAVDPRAMLAVASEGLGEVAEEARERLLRALDALQA